MNELKCIEQNGMIKVYETTEGKKVVDGRELWEGLSVKDTFANWIKSNLEVVDSIIDEDFDVWFKGDSELSQEELKLLSPQQRSRRGISEEYTLSIDVAKEISMITGANPRANSELKQKSKECRKYFIDIEKKYKQLQQDIISQNELIVKAVTCKTVEERILALGDYNSLINKQLLEKDKTIHNQTKVIEKKQEVIQGFSDDVTLAEKRQILNNIIRQGGDYKTIQGRYKELYKNFNMKEHCDLQLRFANYCERFDKLTKAERKEQGLVKIKNKMDYIDKIMDKIESVFELSVKLFNSDVDKLVQDMYDLREVS
jgi:anti-repressor protein